jgi:hypothetical protein
MKKNGKLNTVCDACCDKKRSAYQMNPSRNTEPDYKNTEFEELPDLICVNCFEGHLIGDAKVEFAFQFRIPDAWLEDTVMQIANSLLDLCRDNCGGYSFNLHTVISST